MDFMSCEDDSHYELFEKLIAEVERLKVIVKARDGELDAEVWSNIQFRDAIEAIRVYVVGWGLEKEVHEIIDKAFKVR